MRVIGLVGERGVGMTTVAKMLHVLMDTDRVAVLFEDFEAGVRSIMRKEYDWDVREKGENLELQERITTARRTENPDYWVSHLKNTLGSQWILFFEAGLKADYIIIENVRYPEEAEYVRGQLKGCLVRIGTDMSKPRVEDEIPCDFEIVNEFTFDKENGLSRLMWQTAVTWADIQEWFVEKEKDQSGDGSDWTGYA